MRLGKDLLGLDLYQVLGVGPAATAREIRRAYLCRVRASHPDLNPEDARAGERTVRLNVAARVLLDPALRRLYDAGRSSHFSATSAWYERHTATPASGDWVRVPRRRRATPAAAPLRAFLADLRGVSARISLRLDDALLSLPRTTQRAATLLLIATALWLIASARPRNLWAGEAQGPQPTSVNPHVLKP